MLPFSGYAHSAFAADVDGDGNVDIVVADMRGQDGKMPVYFLMGDGKGGFALDYSRMERPELEYRSAFWTVELLQDSVTKKISLFFAGTEPYTTPAGDSAGNFFNGSKTVLPVAKGHETVMDVIVTNNTAYVLRVLSEPSYGGTAIQKVDFASGNAALIYSHSGWYPGKYLNFPTTWFSWMVAKDGYIEALNGYFGVRVPM